LLIVTFLSPIPRETSHELTKIARRAIPRQYLSLLFLLSRVVVLNCGN